MRRRAACALWLALAVAGCADDDRFCDEFLHCHDAKLPYCHLDVHQCSAVPLPGVQLGDAGPEGDLAVAGERDLAVTPSDDASAILDASSAPMPDSFSRCVDGADCPAGAPICQSGVCVSCTAAASPTACLDRAASQPFCAQSGASAGGCFACPADSENDAYCDDPAHSICVGDGTCRACAAHADCASLLCHSDGKCEPAANIFYVDNGDGACTGSHAGTQLDPVCNLPAMVQNPSDLNGKSIVLIAGRSTGYTATTITPSAAMTITIFGPGRSAAVTARLASLVVSSLDSSTDVTLDGLELGGTVAAKVGAEALHCVRNNAAVTPSLHVRNALVHYSSNNGIGSVACTLTVEDSAIANNDQAGVSANDGVLTADRNVISGNLAAGVTLLGSTSATLINNMIVYNANALSFAGSSQGLVAFDTIAKNTAGVDCGSRPVVVEDSILWQNGSNLTNCAPLDPSNVTGAFGDPVFVDPSSVGHDFHLKASDPVSLEANHYCCIDQLPFSLDAGAAANAHDIDGKPRPFGAGYDVGAHEVQ